MYDEFHRVYTEDNIGFIGPLAVAPDYQGKGFGKLLLDFAESLAEISEVEVVECRADLILMYEKRGYKPVQRVPLPNRIPAEFLSRPDLDFIIYQKLRTTETTPGDHNASVTF